HTCCSRDWSSDVCSSDLWREWVKRGSFEAMSEEWRGPVVRSLITLKLLTFGPTGGIVAAPTTSLPEAIGGQRNWDYRYCWIRDRSEERRGGRASRSRRWP